MSFANPWIFLALLALAIAAWRLLRRGRKRGIRYSATSFLPPTKRGWRMMVAAMVPWMSLAAMALLIVAAARPRTPLARGTRSVDAIAIAMTVDVSGSMEALDFTPKNDLKSGVMSRFVTRLDVVKKVFADFVARRPNDLIGLVTFGGYASTRSPLTADHDALLNVLKGVTIASVAYDAQGNVISGEEQMTAIGDGLATALARLKDAKPSSKIAILLSDGVQTVKDEHSVTPEEATAAAAKMGVKVYVIGIGTTAKNTPYLMKDFFGRQCIQMADMTYDENELRAIASKTGGTYFPVNDRAALEKALSEIDQLETTELEADVFDRWDEHFVGFLILGALLALLATSLSMAATRRLA